MSAVLLLSFAIMAAAPDDIDTFFARFAEKRAGIKILEADLVEETTQYGDVISKTGHVVFGQPRRVIFRYGDDKPSLMVDDRWYYEFDPESEQLSITSIGNSPEASMFFLGFDTDARALQETYDVRLFSVQNAQGSQGLAIRPRKEDANTAPFQEVSIYLRDEDYLPYRVEIVLDEDTQTVTDFSNYRINQPFDPAITQLRIPAGTRIIEDGEVVVRSVPEGGVMMPPEPLEPVARPDASGGKPAEAGGAPATEQSPPALNIQELPAP